MKTKARERKYSNLNSEGVRKTVTHYAWWKFSYFFNGIFHRWKFPQMEISLPRMKLFISFIVKTSQDFHKVTKRHYFSTENSTNGNLVFFERKYFISLIDFTVLPWGNKTGAVPNRARQITDVWDCAEPEWQTSSLLPREVKWFNQCHILTLAHDTVNNTSADEPKLERHQLSNLSRALVKRASHVFLASPSNMKVLSLKKTGLSTAA